jgi:hypothetical protein
LQWKQSGNKYWKSICLRFNELTIDTDNLLLLTGLNNLQTIRTAEMAEVKCILLVRNKKPSEEMLTLAAKENITIITSEKSLFYVSGLLYSAGIKPVY